jgi:pimeloyl-ACP methyl ester carboxylesterase
MWNLLIRHLPNVEIRTVQNPSSAPVPPAQLGDMYDDARAIRETVESVGGPVVVVAHSYGGAPTTQALVGLESVVKRIVYLNAFMPDVGESVVGVLGGPDWFWGLEHVADGYYDMLFAEEVFYSDFEPLAAAMAAADLGPHSVKALEQPVTQAAWHTIPSSYVIGEKDNAIAKEGREFMATRAQRVYRLESSHSPFISQAAQVAALLHQELAEAAKS